MDWRKLIELIPVVANTVNPVAGAAANALLVVIEKELNDRAEADPTFDRDTFIQDANEQWEKDISNAENLLNKGHEGGPLPPVV